MILIFDLMSAIVYLKLTKWRIKLFKYINEENSTWQYYRATNRATNCPSEAEKIGFAKAHDKLIIDFGRQKRNQIQQYITANIWENNKNLKRGTHVKINPKIRNRVISSPRDENITALRKEYESRKSKGRKKQANYFEISRISTVLD